MRVITMLDARRALWGLGLVLCCVWTGCIFVGSDETPSCSPVDLCAPGEPPACGADGKTYTCEAQLTCLGVMPDTSGQACAASCPDTGCQLFCATFKQDAAGCSLCECEGPPPLQCTVVSCPGNVPPVCTPDPPDPRTCPTCTCE